MVNRESFIPEEVEQGLHTDLINLLLDYNSKSKEHFNDIRITTDGYCMIIEWCKRYYDKDFDTERFEYVDEDHVVMKEVQLPDNSYQYAFDDDHAKEIFDDWFEAHPTWKLGPYGRWYDEEKQLMFEETVTKGKQHEEPQEAVFVINNTKEGPER